MLDQISQVCQKCYYQLWQICRVRKSLSASFKLLLILASMHSRLDYCNSVLHSLPWSHLQLLQSVLNSAARLICSIGWFDHITPVLIDLHWLLYPQHVTYKICFIDLRFGGMLLGRDTTEWGSRSSAVAETFTGHLKTHLFRVRFFWLGTHFWATNFSLQVKFKINVCCKKAEKNFLSNKLFP